MPYLEPDLVELGQLTGKRIAISHFQFQYPFYGPDYDNFVQVLSIAGDGGQTEAITSCEAFIEAVNEGEFDTLVLIPNGYPLLVTDNVEAAWVTNDPAIEPITQSGEVYAFSVDGELQPESCPAASS